MKKTIKIVEYIYSRSKNETALCHLMFQLLVKLFLLFCLLVCASAASDEAGAKKLFARQTSNGIEQLMPTPPEKLKPSSKDYENLYAVKPSSKDYENLYTAIATEFAPTVNMAKYLRFSLYELLTTSVGPDGCTPFVSSLPLGKNTLYTSVSTKFKELDFSWRGNIYHKVIIHYSFLDYVSLAGIVAVEKAFSCIKIKRSFAETIKPFGICFVPMMMPPPISSLRPVWPILNQNNISYAEQVILYKGVKLLEQSGETGKVSNNDTSSINDFANVYAKVLLIGTKTTNRSVLSEGSSSC